MKRYLHHRLALFLLAAVAATVTACSGSGPALPTVALLPTLAAPTAGSATVTRPAADVAGRPTLPPVWTATATLTPTATLTGTATAGVTPSATITETPTLTASPLPTIPPQERPRTSLLVDLLADATRLPPGGFVATPPPPPTATLPPGILLAPPTLPPGILVAPPVTGMGTVPTLPPVGATCSFFPAGGFGVLFANNPDIAAALGCPAGSPPDVVQLAAAWQPFQNGLMIWLNGEIFVLRTVDSAFQRYPDSYVAGTDPETGSEAPPAGLVAPVRGFLKVWSTYTEVRPALGWALSPETGVQATVQRFERGRMVWLPGRTDILVFIGTEAALNSGRWRVFSGQF
ncbi:MAG: hypothetical protein MUE40_18860 [Anaerolineae bacterium]|jgi:hypothetical protein|nr:hypothetical protein [Anaerolineae bacterium]